jgi:HAD superfamily hydrolase (TIGR01509 family)
MSHEVLRTAHSGEAMPLAAILDVDGTLIDSNYHHALAWQRAFRRHGVLVPVSRCHRAIGMGSDPLMRHVAGDEVADAQGESISALHGELYRERIDEVPVLDGASELLRELRSRGHLVVLATSAKPQDLERFLDPLGARDHAHGWTSSGDVDRAKPEPDLIAAAMEAVGADDGVMIGDSVWDVEAAAKVGVPTIGVLTGGFSRAELAEAGAVSVYESVAELRERLDETPLASPAGGGA